MVSDAKVDCARLVTSLVDDIIGRDGEIQGSRVREAGVSGEDRLMAGCTAAGRLGRDGTIRPSCSLP